MIRDAPQLAGSQPCRIVTSPVSSAILAPHILLVIPRYAVTACETDHYILVVFVVMSKEEGLCTVKRIHIPMVLGRMGTSQTVLKRSNIYSLVEDVVDLVI